KATTSSTATTPRRAAAATTPATAAPEPTPARPRPRHRRVAERTAAGGTPAPGDRSRSTPASGSAGEPEIRPAGRPARLGGQVARVGRGQVHAGRHEFGHGHAEPAELFDLVRVVAQQ